MRHRARLLIALFAFAASLAAAAATRAAVLPFQASLSIQLRDVASLTVTGQGVATLNGSGGLGHLTQLTLPATFVATTQLSTPVTDIAAFPFVGFQISLANSLGFFIGSGGAGFGGVMPVLGVAKICLFATCGGPPPANLSVPLSVMGLGGSATGTSLVPNVVGAPWTTGTVTAGVAPSFFTTVVSGFVHGPASGTSSTVAAGGAIRLVTPLLVSTSIAADVPFIPIYGILDLVFVPEPGTAILLVSVLAWILWHRPRRGSR